MAVLAAVLLAALAGCGGDDATVASRAPPTATSTETTPEVPQTGGSPRDALIRVSDLSSSWRGGRPMGNTLECDGWDPMRAASRTIESQHFRRDSIDVQQTLGVFADDAAGGKALRRLNDAATKRCTRRQLRSYLRFGSGGGIAFVEPVSVVREEDLGEHSYAVRYAADFSSELERGTAYIVTINTQTGRAASSLTLYSGVQHLAEEAYDQLATAQERRVDAVFG